MSGVADNIAQRFIVIFKVSLLFCSIHSNGLLNDQCCLVFTLKMLKIVMIKKSKNRIFYQKMSKQKHSSLCSEL